MYNFYNAKNANIKDELGFTPRDYYDMLSNIWCSYTCAPRYRKEWSEQNKTLGQCSITAFLIQDIYGGEVRGVRLPDGGYHCFNVVGDCLFDLTSEQFGSTKLDYGNCPVQSRSEHFALEEKKQRYEYLKEKLFEARKLFKKENVMEEQIITVTIKTKGETCNLTDEQIKAWYETAIKNIFNPEYGTPDIDVKVERKPY